jgi:hypothetical protein
MMDIRFYLTLLCKIAVCWNNVALRSKQARKAHTDSHFKILTVCFRVLDKLNFLWWFGFRLESIFNTVTVASKNDARFKSGQS